MSNSLLRAFSAFLAMSGLMLVRIFIPAWGMIVGAADPDEGEDPWGYEA